MSEGGCYPWKRQIITGNPADYSCLNQPLPQLPKSQQWVREGREWKIVDVGKEGETGTGTENDNDAKGRVPEECDFVQHFVKPTDTLQGISLKYGVKPVVLRQINKFSGSNLNLAPQTLIIPLERSHVGKGKNEPDVLSKEEKINKFILTFRNHKISTLVSRKEAIAYLDMNDGDLELAIKDAKEDFGWEMGENEESSLL